MSVRRIMGIETEYGIVQRGNPRANPMLMSSQVVLAYRSLRDSAVQRTRWDYLDEDPLLDARGFHLQRAAAHPSLLTDDPSRPAPSGEDGADGSQGKSAVVPPSVVAQPRSTYDGYEDPGAANAVLPNGARLYVDHAHPEYSSPEVTNPLDAVRWDAAGEQVMLRGAVEASRLTGTDLVVYKNNADGKGASYGTHENYLVDREVPFGTLVDLLTPFFVTRQVFTGSGRVGLGATGDEPGFQLSQRADYIEAEVGLETTLRRPIINTRDEPHADRTRWRRLHVILGDANLFQVATYLKLGTTSLVLWLAEHLEDLPPSVRERLDALRLHDPVTAVHRVSRDLTLAATVETQDGRHLTALEVQSEYLDAVRDGIVAVGDPDDPATSDVVDRWASVLDRLATDRWSCTGEVEWLGKLHLLERLRDRESLAWDHPRVVATDLQWADLRPERGVARRLLAAGAVERLVSDAEASRAVSRPPHDTRAFFRGSVVMQFPEHVSAASWDSVVLDVPGADTLSRVPMPDPHRGTEERVGALLRSVGSVAELVAALSL